MAKSDEGSGSPVDLAEIRAEIRRATKRTAAQAAARSNKSAAAKKPAPPGATVTAPAKAPAKVGAHSPDPRIALRRSAAKGRAPGEGDAEAAAEAPPPERVNAALSRLQRLYKESHQRFQDFLNATSDWLWETDDASRILFISERITEVIGKPASLLAGKTLFEICDAVSNGAGETIHDAMDARRPFRNLVVDIRDAEGQIRRCHLSGMPVFDKDTERFTGFRGTGSDATARYRAEDTARKSQKRLESTLEELHNNNLQLEMALAQAKASTHAKTQILANMSHELRTPLNAIIGFSEMLEGEMLGALGNKRYKEYARNILVSGHHLLSIITDILNMAKLESGKLELKEAKVDVALTVEACRQLMADRAEGAGVELATFAAEDPPALWGDERLVKQMLLNLMSNAVKFTPEGGRITVAVTPLDDGRLALSVEDTGIGIAPEDLDKVMSEFGQVDSAFARDHDGTGLGLPLVKAMIELHGGTFEFESAPGVGTTATLIFPAERLLDPDD